MLKHLFNLCMMMLQINKNFKKYTHEIFSYRR